MRLWVLTDGVTKGVFAAGVLRDELVPDRALSLLRERLDDDGDSGTCAEAMVSGSVLMRPPLSFALRLRARSLCSLKKLRLLSRGDSGGGSGGTRKLEDGMVAGGTALACRQWRQGVEVIGWADVNSRCVGCGEQPALNVSLRCRAIHCSKSMRVSRHLFCSACFRGQNQPQSRR